MSETDYSNLSDFEINKLVAKKLGVYHEGWEHLIDEDTKGAPVLIGNTTRWIDYCNDWSVMGSLTGEYEILIIHNKHGGKSVAYSNRVHSYGCEISDKIDFDDKVTCENPLRAAAIVFLEMGE